MKEKYSIKKCDLFYYLFLALIVFYYSLQKTVIEINGFKFLLFVSIILLMIYVGLKRWKINKKYLATSLVGILIAVINFAVTSDGRLLCFTLAVLFLYDIPVRMIFYLMFYEKLIITVSLIFLALTGFIENIIQIRGDGTVRYALGFSHPNRMAIEISILLFLYLCINKNKITGKKVAILFLMVLLCYVISDSRTGLACGLLTIFLLLVRKKHLFFKCFTFFSGLIFFALMALSIYLPIQIHFNGILLIGRFIPDGIERFVLNIISSINAALNYRISLGYMFFVDGALSFFGQKPDYDFLSRTYDYVMLDSGYLNILFTLGIVGSLVFLVLNQLTLNWLLKREETIYAIIMFVFFVWAFTENILFSLGTNLCFVFCAMYLREKMTGKDVLFGE